MDHRPLQSIFNKPLHQAPARLHCFLLQLQKYDLQVTYKPGKYLYLADTLCRSYFQETKEQLVSETEIIAINPKSYSPISPEKYAQFQRETAKDLELKALSSVILKGWPDNREDVSPAVRQYWSYRDELTCLDGLLFKGDKIVVPKTLQSEMLEKIRETHQGIVKRKNRARQVRNVCTHRSDCGSLRIVCRTLESKRKGAIDSDGDSRTTLGEGRTRSF